MTTTVYQAAGVDAPHPKGKFQRADRFTSRSISSILAGEHISDRNGLRGSMTFRITSGTGGRKTVLKGAVDCVPNLDVTLVLGNRRAILICTDSINPHNINSHNGRA